MPADDPYRTLGLERGASLDEVKRAYRRLVKANHPDAAGEAALPRFLAIQDAYDRIVGPDESNGHSATKGAPRSPWEADPDRAGATFRAYGGRPRPRPGPRTGPRRPARPAGSAPPKNAGGAASTRAAGTAGPEGAAGGAGAAGGTARPASDGQASDASERRRKKATLGSTSYDDVDPEAFAPDWGGASWYGTTSGTYWTINPKEYADPRKHGPEYQARARRAGRGRSIGTSRESPQTGSDPAPAGATIAGDAPPISQEMPPRTSPPPTHTTSSWWEATAGDPTTTSTGAAGSASAPPRARPSPAYEPGPPPVHDYAAVDWAVAYRVNAGEDDIVIMPSTFGAGLDPSTRRRDRNPDLFGTGKWNRVLIDATINLDYDPDPELGGARFPPTVWPEKGDIEKAYARWTELGLGKPKGG